jgi:hypothetical protein
MTNRRKVLISLGGAMAVAGCSGETEESEPDQDEEDDSEEQESDSGQTEEVEPAQAEFTNISPENPTVVIGDDLEISAELENTGGEAGEFEVELHVEEETISTKMVEVESGESEPVSMNLNTGGIAESLGPGEYEHTFVTETDEISTSVTYTEPEEPASFEVVKYNIPETVEIGEEITLTITVRNTGEQEGDLSAPIYARTPNSSWQEGGEVKFNDVAPGKTSTVEVGTISLDYINRYEYRLGTSSKTTIVQTVSAKEPWGDEYTTPAGYRVIVDRPDLQDTYNYEDFQGDIVQKEPEDGGQWAFVDVWVKNETGETAYSPLASEFGLLYDDSQSDGETILIDEPVDKDEPFEGGELQPGVERSGWVAYQMSVS